MESSYFNSGINKAKLGLHDEAIEDFEKASWEDPDNFEIQFNLGTAYLTIGEFEQAIVNLDRAINISPKNSDAWGNRAVAKAAIGEDSSMIEFVVEPYLLQIGFILRTNRGRVLTSAGKSYIEFKK